MPKTKVNLPFAWYYPHYHLLGCNTIFTWQTRYLCFGETYCPHLHTGSVSHTLIVPGCSSETLVLSYKTRLFDCIIQLNAAKTFTTF